MDNDSKKLGNVISINQDQIKDHLGEIVRSTVEETLNGLLDAEADQLCNAKRYERTSGRRDTRAGSYNRSLETKAGKVSLTVPKLRSLPFETAIIERYRRRESSVEEALVQMYLAGVSVRRVEDITEALWGNRVSPSTVSEMNKKIYKRIDEWRNRPILSDHPYVYLDGVYLKRSWGGEVQSIAVLVAFGVSSEGYREILGVCEGAKEDKASWLAFLRHLKSRGLSGTKLFISDKCLGLVESIGECFPEAKWQRCVVHFYRNVFSVVPKGKVKEVATMLKAIHAQEDGKEASEKARSIAEKLKAMKLKKASELISEGIEETLVYYQYPREHWRRIRTNNPMERIMREIRRRTRVVGNFPDGESALMLVAARLRHISATKWGSQRYLNMDLLKELEEEIKVG
jgi:transposase-like protein